MFELVGETLRRIRKDRGKTLQQLAAEAGLGRGQLSRIENGHQEATLKTLAKILEAQGVSRREFFRRYDLVENEARALEASSEKQPAESDVFAGAAERHWPGEIQEVLAKVESFVQTTFHHTQPVAQGAIEVGEFVVLFRVLPRHAAPAAEPPPKPPTVAPAPRLATRRRGRRRKR